jgi:hypothetical protein
MHNLKINYNTTLTLTPTIPCLATAVCCRVFFSAFNFGIPRGHKWQLTNLALPTNHLSLTKVRLSQHTPHTISTCNGAPFFYPCSYQVTKCVQYVSIICALHASTVHIQHWPLGTVRPRYRTGTPLTSQNPILRILSTNIRPDFFKRAAHSPFFSLQNAVYFTMLPFLVPVLFAFYIQVC